MNKIFIVSKNGLFYEINIYDENIPLFVSSTGDAILEKMIVEELCNKNITDKYCGLYHFMAKTKDNKIYCWGHNYLGRLGNGKEVDDSKDYSKPELNITLSELYIDVIKCGKNHWLALTRSGEVCTWGG